MTAGVTLEDAEKPSETDDHDDPARAASRPASWTFGAVEVVALLFYLVLARTQFFFADEWEFLALRGVNVHDIFREHYRHWVSIPLLVYRLLWNTVGMHSYLPYAAIAIVLHLVAAALLRVVMLRAGVRPWTATIVASAFVLFGAGAQDILWGFQMTFTGALVFGLVHLLLADHDGGLDRRDWVGLAAGLFALMFSAVGVTLALVAGVALVLRRGWRIAAIHTVPLGVVYIVWWQRSGGNHSFAATPRQIFDWSAASIGGLFGALGQIPGAGWVLGAFLVAGLVLAWRTTDRAARRDLALPIALLVGAVLFLTMAGFDRSGVGTARAHSGRYLHMLAALSVPALAVAADAVLRRSRAFGIIGLAVLVLGVPGNILKARDFAHHQHLVTGPTRHTMLAVPRLPLAREVPASVEPDPNLPWNVTVGWLLQSLAEGRLPKPRAAKPLAVRTDELRLSLMQIDTISDPDSCRPLTGPTNVQMVKGDSVGIQGAVLVASVKGAVSTSAQILYGHVLMNSPTDHSLVATTGPLQLLFSPTTNRGPASLCVAPGASRSASG